MLSNFRGVPFLFSCFWICMLTKILRFLFQGLKCTLSGRAELRRAELRDCCVSFRNASLDRFGHQLFVASFATLFFFNAFPVCRYSARINNHYQRETEKMQGLPGLAGNCSQPRMWNHLMDTVPRLPGRSDEHGPFHGSNNSQIIALDKFNKEPVAGILTYFLTCPTACEETQRVRTQSSLYLAKQQLFQQMTGQFWNQGTMIQKTFGTSTWLIWKVSCRSASKKASVWSALVLENVSGKRFVSDFFLYLEAKFAAQCTQDADSQFPPQSDRSREGA